MRIRPYRAEDWDAFIALEIETGLRSMPAATAEERALFGARWPDQVRSLYAWSDAGPTTGGSALFILEEGGRVLGHVWIMDQHDFFSGKPKLWVTSIAVATEARRRGFGKLLLDWAASEAKRRGCDTVALGVDATNHDAVRLYERSGYRTTRYVMELSVP